MGCTPCHDRTVVAIRERACDWKRIATDRFNLNFGKIRRVTFPDHLSNERDINFLLEYKVAFAALCPFREFIFSARNLLMDFERYLCFSLLGMKGKPFPILIHAAEFVVLVFGRDQYIGVQKVQHAS